jgi:hypothetical protein
MAEVTCPKQNLLTSEETFRVYSPRKGKTNAISSEEIRVTFHYCRLIQTLLSLH